MSDTITEQEAQAHVEAVVSDPESRYVAHCPHCAAAFRLGLWDFQRAEKP